MSLKISSPYTKPADGMRIKRGAPSVPKPGKQELESFPSEAKKIIDGNWSAQKSLIQSGQFDLEWMAGRHFVLAGATGPGLGGALATAVLNQLGESGSLTVISRDLTRSVGFETGNVMRSIAEEKNLENRFHWLNSGLALDGDRLDSILAALKEAGAKKVIYINTVAAAISGVLPGYPPVYVIDNDEEGLFQWELQPLNEQSVESTKFVMGEMAVEFSHVLEEAGIAVEATAFADWRGSLDIRSRDPASKNYGQWGPYSTSLCLPKDFLRAETRAAYGTSRVVIDCFFPVMKTRALWYIPGGKTLANVFDKFMQLEGVRHIDVPELAIGTFDKIGRALRNGEYNPFPRLDVHEKSFDLWFFEIVKKMNTDKNSKFYFKKWLA